jgi:hypothetical protein
MATIDETEARLNSHEAVMKALKEYLSYDHKTGKFACIKNSGKRKIGDSVGVHNGRYLQIGFGGYRERAHRLAWMYVYGYIPTEIDHINGDGLDNRICNLREVTHQQNIHNHRKPPSHNTTGLMGVSYYKAGNKFAAHINLNGKKKHLGYFHKPDDAHQAYLQAKRKLHSTCTI